MNAFSYIKGELHAESVPLSRIASEYGTPCYVYSKATIEDRYHAYASALAGTSSLICYAVKANSNLAILQSLARQGAGFDIVSVGELRRVIAAGGDPGKVIFSGVGKTEAEIQAALEAGILCFNVESREELERIDQIAAKMSCIAPVSLRINPDVDAQTHPYISTGLKENKFGIDSSKALAAFRLAAKLPNLNVLGIDCHIGSQLTSLAPFLDALDRLLSIVDGLANEGIQISHLDIGGGLGVPYEGESPPEPVELIDAVKKRIAQRELTLLLEPGRSIVAEAGIFLVKVEYIKETPHKRFVVVDGAMNDLLRPALYSAWQEIQEVSPPEDGESALSDVVGPVCESADFLGKDRELNAKSGDLLAVRMAGAYGFVMSSNYNTRPRAPELMVDGTRIHVIRRRETTDDLLALEQLLPD